MICVCVCVSVSVNCMLLHQCLAELQHSSGILILIKTWMFLKRLFIDCVHEGLCVRVCMCASVCMCAYMCICACACMYACLCTNVCVIVYLYVCIYMFAHACTCAFVCDCEHMCSIRGQLVGIDSPHTHTPCGSKGQTHSWNLAVRSFTCRAIPWASNLPIELKSWLKELNRKEMPLLLVEKGFEGPPPPPQQSMYLRVSLPIQKQATLLSHFWKAKFGDLFFLTLILIP